VVFHCFLVPVKSFSFQLFRARDGDFSVHHRIQTGSGTLPASYPMGIVGSFPGGGVKRPGREVEQSPPSSAEFRTAWSYTSTPPIRLHGVVLS
jgi:hypothetical protein